MLASQLLDFRAMLEGQGVIFAYSGYVTEPVLSGVGEALKQKLTIDDADTKTLRSVFAVFVEQMQNIIRYSAEKAMRRCLRRGRSALKEIRYGILTIGKEGGDYVVYAGNLIERPTSSAFTPSSADPRHEQGRAEGPVQGAAPGRAREGSKGAGLGFMEIARRASKPIEFDFIDLDNKHASSR